VTSPPARRIVLVSGAPGAGKSTLARPLAAVLCMPLLTKDAIKESLADSLGLGDGSAAWSTKLGGAAMELMWTLAAQAPAAVLEANFRPYSDYERRRIEGLAATVVEVHCACPPQEAARRYTERGRRANRHAIHVLRAMTADQMAEYDRPIGLGRLVITDTGAPVDVADLAARVSQAFSQADDGGEPGR
jgi:predicted kinase